MHVVASALYLFASFCLRSLPFYFSKNNGLARADSFDEDKVIKLECDNDDLTLQVSVLTEQIAAQSEKVKDLESIIDSMTKTRECTDEMMEHVSSSALTYWCVSASSIYSSYYLRMR